LTDFLVAVEENPNQILSVDQSKGGLEVSEIAQVLREFEVQLIGFDSQYRFALNFGDCFYAIAKSKGVPLLFTGNDFSRTDLLKARP